MLIVANKEGRGERFVHWRPDRLFHGTGAVWLMAFGRSIFNPAINRVAKLFLARVGVLVIESGWGWSFGHMVGATLIPVFVGRK